MDENTKAKMKVKYDDLFENSHKNKDSENQENDTKTNVPRRNTSKDQEES